MQREATRIKIRVKCIWVISRIQLLGYQIARRISFAQETMQSRIPVRDYYEILGLDRSASQEEVRASYRQLAMKYHPDVTGAGESEYWIRLINEAYEVLGNPGKRAFYDYIYFANQKSPAQQAGEAREAKQSGDARQAEEAQQPGEHIEVTNLLLIYRTGKFRSFFSKFVIQIVRLQAHLDILFVSLILLVAALYLVFQQDEMAAGLMILLLASAAIILLVRILAELFGRLGIRIEEP